MRLKASGLEAPKGRALFHYFLGGRDSTPNAEFEKVVEGCPVTPALIASHAARVGKHFAT
jgi:hypothetical protein